MSVTLIVSFPSEDKGALAKLVEAIKTNYNDRYEEVSIHFHIGISRNIKSIKLSFCEISNLYLIDIVYFPVTFSPLPSSHNKCFSLPYQIILYSPPIL